MCGAFVPLGFERRVRLALVGGSIYLSDMVVVCLVALGLGIGAQWLPGKDDEAEEHRDHHDGGDDPADPAVNEMTKFMRLLWRQSWRVFLCFCQCIRYHICVLPTFGLLTTR